MTAPTKPVAWMGRGVNNNYPLFALDGEVQLSGFAPWTPLYDSAALQAARDEGCRAGIEACIKATGSVVEEEWKSGDVDHNEIPWSLHVQHKLRELTPETVLKEKA